MPARLLLSTTSVKLEIIGAGRSKWWPDGKNSRRPSLVLLANQLCTQTHAEERTDGRGERCPATAGVHHRLPFSVLLAQVRRRRLGPSDGPTQTDLKED